MKQIFRFSNALCKSFKIRTNTDRKLDRDGKIYCFELDYNLSIPLPELLRIKKIILILLWYHEKSYVNSTMGSI